LLHDENSGNLALTDDFRKYVQHRGFKLHFCRKGDPASKGKVENVVKYVKYNFLRGRIYVNIDALNGQAVEWLERTANAKTHAATRKVPREEWILEREHLKTVSGIFIPEQVPRQYTVRKDNTISYKSNFYELPGGSYQGPGTTVGVKIVEGQLVICQSDNTEMVRYKIYKGKGRLIGNSNFKRDYSAKIEELIAEVASHFEHPHLAKTYFEQVRRDNPRYIRDQLLLVRKLIHRHGMQIMDKALGFCMENNILKATDMESLAGKLALEDSPQEELPPPSISIKTINEVSFKISPQKSDISDYQNLMK